MIVIDEKYLRVHVCIGAAIKYFELNWIIEVTAYLEMPTDIMDNNNSMA